jgi:hypothetical protein
MVAMKNQNMFKKNLKVKYNNQKVSQMNNLKKWKKMISFHFLIMMMKSNKNLKRKI